MATAHDTLSLLEARLRRLDYLVHGDVDSARTIEKFTNGSAAARLRGLERSLQSLSSRSSAVSEVLDLQRQHPELFHAASSSDTVPAALLTSSLGGLILAHSQLYEQSAARLGQLQDLSVPDPSSATRLVSLQRRIEQARVRHAAHAKQVAELRARSAKAVEAWYEGGVLGMNEQWADWEERLRDAEILVRRSEAAKKREGGLV